MTFRKKVLLIIISLLLVAVGYVGLRAGRVLWYPNSEMRQSEQQDLMDNYYGCLRLSMLSTEELSKGDIEYFRGISTKEVEYCFRNLKDMNAFLEDAYGYQEALGMIYLYLDPVEIGKQYGGMARFYGEAYRENLVTLMSQHPETSFECVIPAYSAAYLSGLSDKERNNLETYIIDFFNVLEGQENVNIYYVGFEEWLVSNEANYIDERLYNHEVNSFVTALVIRDDYYALTRENLQERLNQARQIASDYGTAESSDLSGYEIVFLGDSVFGNYTDSMSIPGVVAGLTGANTFNCAQGGCPATNDEEALLSFERMVSRFICGDITELEDCVYKAGVQEYLEKHEDDKKLCFVINFGLNDFFGGHAVANVSDANDSKTFAGAMRNGIRMLREAYPEASILVMSPNQVIFFGNGTEPQSEVGGALEEYVEAARDVAGEFGVAYLDIYSESVITVETSEYYLEDGCHPGERGRFVLGQEIIRMIEEIN